MPNQWSLVNIADLLAAAVHFRKLLLPTRPSTTASRPDTGSSLSCTGRRWTSCMMRLGRCRSVWWSWRHWLHSWRQQSELPTADGTSVKEPWLDLFGMISGMMSVAARCAAWPCSPWCNVAVVAVLFGCCQQHMTHRVNSCGVVDVALFLRQQLNMNSVLHPWATLALNAPDVVAAGCRRSMARSHWLTPCLKPVKRAAS